MKRNNIYNIIPLIILTTILLIFSSCKNNEAFSPVFRYDNNNVYSGFDGIPDNLTPDEAVDSGYVIVDGLVITDNSDIWDDFVEESNRGKNTSVRLVHIYNNSSVFLLDIFYNDGKYYLFDNSVESQNIYGYANLLQLEGTFGSPARESIAVILADDNTLTLDKYMTAMYSSNTEVINSVQPSRLIMILIPED